MWFLGGSYTMGNNLIYAAYGHQDKASGATYSWDADTTIDNFDNEYSSWEIVGIHSLSKQTLVYAGYISVNPDASGVDDSTAYALGMKHKF